MIQAEITDIVEKQKKFFLSQQTKNIQFRLKALTTLKKAILEYEQKIHEALSEDLHKSNFESYATEIGITLEEISYHKKHLKRWAKSKKVYTPLFHFLSWSSIHPEPYGTVLIISPWNYPFQLLINPLIGAISAGNCAVLKPAELSEKTSAVLKEMIEKYFPPEYISIFTGGRETNEILLKEKYDYIFFTGSQKLGKIVMQEAAKTLTPVTLELGGKSPCIVDEDANLDIAARRIAWGKFINAGQTCIAPDYLYIHESVKNEFIGKLKEQIHLLFGKDIQSSPNFPRIINDFHFKRLVGLMNEMKIIFGGEIDEKEKYISPTILDNITIQDEIMQDEIFGPLLPILTFKKIDEVIFYLHSQPKPLALYYFSSNKKNQKNIISKISSGGVCINDTLMHIANNHLPFGGVGNSGMGQYHGKYSFDTFTHYRAVLKKSTVIDIPIRYAPYKNKLNLIKKILK